MGKFTIMDMGDIAHVTIDGFDYRNDLPGFLRFIATYLNGHAFDVSHINIIHDLREKPDDENSYDSLWSADLYGTWQYTESAEPRPDAAAENRSE